MTGADSLAHRCPRCGYDHGGERSGKSHRFFFAAVAAAFDSWPHSHPFQPVDAEHLRAWLFAKVEFCGTMQGAPRSVREMRKIALQMRTDGTRFFFDTTAGHDILLKVPRTSVMAASGGPTKSEFLALVDRVIGAIEEETGITRESLRREAAIAVARKAGLGKRRAA